MKDYYEELHLDRNKNLDELKKELSKLESTWKRREINSPEKATKMLAIIIEAREVFKTLDSRLLYDQTLEKSKQETGRSGPEDSRIQKLERFKNQAKSFLETGQEDLALAAIEKALALRDANTEDGELLMLAGDIYSSCGDGRRALRYINEAIVMNPDMPLYYILKGIIYERLALRSGYPDSCDYFASGREALRIAKKKSGARRRQRIKSCGYGKAGVFTLVLQQSG